MNEYLYIDYDEDSIANYDRVNLSLSKCFKEYNKLDSTDLDDMFDAFWEDIQMYKTRLTVIYDGVDVFGFIAYSKIRFLNHRVIQFVYLVEPKEERITIGRLLDVFSNHINNPYLAVITKDIGYNSLEQSGFFNIRLSNKEGLTFLMRKQNMSSPKSTNDINEYYLSHKKYKRMYILIYSSIVYFLALTFLGFGGALLLHFNNANFNLSSSIYSYIAFISVFVVFVFLTLSMKVHKKNGNRKFGFEYDMVAINTTEFKFHDKFREFFLTGIKVFMFS